MPTPSNQRIHDVIVLGSGAAGAPAAAELVESGLDVLIVDGGFDDSTFRENIPDKSYSEIRAGDPAQGDYFIGPNLEGVPRGNIKVGAQLTPPRQFITKGVEDWLPLRSDTFFPMQSLAVGGLGAGWGAAAYAFSPHELHAAGLIAEATLEGAMGFRRYYDRAAELMGISCESENDITPFCMDGVRNLQPPLDIDSSARALLKSYGSNREKINARGLYVGRSPMAILSRDKGNRRANPYFDMDFFSDSRRSVYRPRYLIEDLRSQENGTHMSGMVAVRFEEQSDGTVRLFCRRVADGTTEILSARALVLCCGPVNSARISLQSLGLTGTKTPILSSPYTYLPCINYNMLGAPADDRRHSLSQICGIQRTNDDIPEELLLQFYSYRSLLLFKIAKEIPLPAFAGKMLTRLIMNSLTIVGLFQPDRVSEERSLMIEEIREDKPASLLADSLYSSAEIARRKDRENTVRKNLLKMGCLAFQRIDPGNGSSIHYAGTIPRNSNANANANAGSKGPGLSTDQDNRLQGTERVFIGDSSTWNYLPAKGLTFTIAAGAVQAAEKLGDFLRS